MENVLYVPGLNVNLFSTIKYIDKPEVKFKGTYQNLVLIINGVRIDFDKQLTYGSVKLYASDITPTINYD
jgi:hypothetical protein